jgi:glycosyltransferase involved in cell wall biosynthesis
MISIIIPCYNCANFIERALKSVFNQTYKDLEILLVNNNSTDGTLGILETYQRNFPEMVRVFSETKAGAPAARNKGLKEAKGEWIQFLDADDEILPEKLSGQITLANELKASIVVSPYRKEGTRHKDFFSFERPLYGDDVWSALIISQMGITSSNLWTREVLLKVGGWDESLVASQEYDMMFRILQLNPIVAFDHRNLTMVYVGSGESVSRSGSKEKARLILDSRINLRLRIKEYLESQEMLTKERLFFINKWIYQTLVRNYRFHQDIVLENLERLQLQVPFNARIKGFYAMRKMDLKRLLYKYKILK